MERSARRLTYACFVLLAASTASTPSRATMPPVPGHEFPAEYRDFKRDHPELFEIKGGLRRWVERARAERLRRGPGRQPGRPPGSARSTRGSGGAGAAAATAVSGTVTVPVLPIQFTPLAAPAPPSQAAIDLILFSGGGGGTVTDYYDEVSYGLLNLTGTVFPYTQVGQPDTFYENGANGLPPNGRTGDLLQDTLTLADATVNFGLFDNDGPDGMPNSGDDDGVVDLVAFLIPERGGECGTSNIWAHRWVYRGWFPSAFTTNDARSGGGFIRVDDYTIQPALDCANAPLQIGTFAHEAGHIFGIPDLYDTDGSSQGLGNWSLMAGGSWNTQASPAHMSAWEKAELGWLTPTLLTDPNPPAATDIAAVETTPEAFQVVVGNGEYFLIENRQVLGFDANLATCGLAIYHVDAATILARTQSNSVNAFENCGAFVQQAQAHYGIALEQADGNCDLEAGVNRGDAGDLFRGSTNSMTFDANSNPSSDAYMFPTDVAVRNISACGDPMNATIEALASPGGAGGKVDVVFLIDNTGSYFDDYPNIDAQMPSIVAKLSAAFGDVRFGLAVFRDFPFGSFGGPGDFAYQLREPLTASTVTFLNAVTDLTVNQPPFGGADQPESQYEAIFQALTGLGRDLDGNTIKGDSAGEIAPSDMGWLPGRHRVVYLLTDADFHDSDTESYPGTPLEAIGRNALRGLIANTFPPQALTLFVMVAENSGVFVSQGEDGSVPNLPPTMLFEQADELTVLTGGGVFRVETDSIALEDSIDVTIAVLENSRLVPTLSAPGLLAMGGLLLGAMLLAARRRASRSG